MKHFFSFLAIVVLLVSHFCMAQMPPRNTNHSKPNNSTVAKSAKKKASNMTINQFLKTTKGQSLPNDVKELLAKLPPKAKLSELMEVLENPTPNTTNVSTNSLYNSIYIAPIKIKFPFLCCVITYIDGTKPSCCTETPPPPPPTPTVVNRVETVGQATVKVYLQEPATSSNRKGIMVIGSGNNEFAPSVGDLNGALENEICKKMAEQGYIAAIVKYTQMPIMASNYSNWNTVSTLMAQEYNKAINGLIGKYGGSRSQVIAAGVSYTSFLLFTNIAYGTELADIKGFMGTCGGTGADQAANFKIPIASISCFDDFESQYNLNGEDLVSLISIPSIQINSYGKRDMTCSGHCNGNVGEWADWLVSIAKLWLP